jgi:hypothetical protein
MYVHRSYFAFPLLSSSVLSYNRSADTTTSPHHTFPLVILPKHETLPNKIELCLDKVDGRVGDLWVHARRGLTREWRRNVVDGCATCLEGDGHGGGPADARASGGKSGSACGAFERDGGGLLVAAPRAAPPTLDNTYGYYIIGKIRPMMKPVPATEGIKIQRGCLTTSSTRTMIIYSITTVLDKNCSSIFCHTWKFVEPATL